MNSASDVEEQAETAKPVSPPITETTSSPAALDKAPDKPRWAASVGLAPVVLALLTAMFYLNGRSYFLGYLDHLHLEPTMFSDDLSNQVTHSVLAWLHATINFATWFRAQFKWTTVAILAAPVAALFALCLVTAVVRGLAFVIVKALRWMAPSGAKLRKRPALSLLARWARWIFAPPLFARAFMSGIASVYLAGYLATLIVWVISIVLIVLVLPFDAVGRSVAADDVAEKFTSSPAVVINNAEGHPATYRIILCAPQYCALYDGKQALTVVASKVNDAVSPPPGPLPKKSP